MTRKTTVIRSVGDPLQFYPFGAWRSADDVAAMRRDPRAPQAIEAARSLCTAATPGSYQLVRRTPAPQTPAQPESPPPTPTAEPRAPCEARGRA